MATQLQQHTSTLKITIDDNPLDDAIASLLAYATIDDSRVQPDLFTLSFRDQGREVIAGSAARIGAVVKISVIAEDTPAAGEDLITGEITALETEYDGAGALTVIRGYDHSHRLFRGRRTETYVDVTYADVVRKVAARVNLEVGEVKPTRGVHQHVTQANATDWQFLQRLAREVGYQLAVADGKVRFCPPTEAETGPGDEASLESTDPLQLVLGSNVLRLHAVVTAAHQVDQVEVRGWDVAAKRALVANAPASTTSAAVGVTPDGLSGLFGGGVHVSADTPYGRQSDVDTAVSALADEVASSFAELDGVARGNPRLKAGAAVRLSLVGEPFDGRYTLSSTRHRYDPEDGYTTSFTVSGPRDRTLLGLVGSPSGASRASGSSGGSGGGLDRVAGVVSALVSDTGDPERLGRVKLHFPWLSGSYTTYWARVAQPGAGNNRGGMMLPEVNDEVLVAFEHGDINRPYVIGGLYNGVDRPPLTDNLIDPTSGAVQHRGFASKNDHRLVFRDAPGDSQIFLGTGGERAESLSLDQTKREVRLRADTGVVEINGGREVTIRTDGNLTLEAAGKLTLRGGTVSVTGSGPTEVKGNPIKLN
ncbi:MAG: VgrG-related protein [Micromonosporaceae bacterium]|nr:VgrG-related protein [Micromonosporaceae bacterium]